MRKFCLLALLALSSCGPNDAASVPDGNDAAAAPADNLLANLGNGAMDATQLQELVTRAMATALPGAKDAQYRNLRPGTGGAACGEVTGKGKSDFKPFVVTPEALAVIDDKPTIAYGDPSDFFADAWIRWCATPDELARVGPQIKAGQTDDAAANMAATIPTVPDPLTAPVPEPNVPARPVPATPPARPRAAPPKPDIDSFLKSVQHNGQ